MEAFLSAVASLDPTVVSVYQAIVRYAVPILVAILLIRTVRPLLTFRCEPEIWAWLMLTNGKRLPITHWENVIGRSRRSDVVINIPTVSRSHAVLTRYDDGSWSISDAGSKAGVYVNGQPVHFSPIDEEDIINIGGVEMTLLPISRQQEMKLAQLRTKAAHPIGSISIVMILTLLQVLICLSYLMTGDEKHLRGVKI